MLYLKDLPVDTLKIDKEFTKYIVNNKFNEQIVRTIIGLGTSLHLDLICEGVENYDYLERAMNMGIEKFQGYHFAKPISSEAVFEYIDKKDWVSGEGAASLIGHHGDTLDALQYLANLACAQLNSKGERDHSRVTIDIEGYRAKREGALRAVARRMAEKAKRTHRNVMLEPMSPYERRIIHDEVSGIEGVTTSSVGSDNNRRVVIYFERKPAENAVREKEPVSEPVPETASEPEFEIEIEEEDEIETETEIGTDMGADTSSVSDDGDDATEQDASEEENPDGDPA